MGLDTLVRKGVAIAQKVTKTLQVPITITTPTEDFEGRATATTRTTVTGFVERRKQLRRDPDGRMVECDERVLLLGDVTVALTATLADDEGALGPVLYVGGFRDPQAGTYYTEVWCGTRSGTSFGTR